MWTCTSTGALTNVPSGACGTGVSVVCRSAYGAVAADGFDIQSKSWGDFVFRPAQVLRSATQLLLAPDYVLLCVKTVRGLDRPALVREAMGPNTVLTVIGNG